MTTQIVTKDSLRTMLNNPNQVYVMHVVGRALTALFKRQTDDEKSSNDTRVWNTVGFSGADAKSGSLTAKSYLKNKKLEQWQVDKWLKIGKNGYPRLCKYHSQLNEIAKLKQK